MARCHEVTGTTRHHAGDTRPRSLSSLNRPNHVLDRRGKWQGRVGDIAVTRLRRRQVRLSAHPVRAGRIYRPPLAARRLVIQPEHRGRLATDRRASRRERRRDSASASRPATWPSRRRSPPGYVTTTSAHVAVEAACPGPTRPSSPVSDMRAAPSSGGAPSSRTLPSQRSPARSPTGGDFSSSSARGGSSAPEVDRRLR